MSPPPAAVERCMISLEDYSTFQYMLARPALAKPIIGQITSFVFYNEPRDGRKKETAHRVLVRGRTTLVNYYACCLGLLPSHILGMSRWISSAEECRASENSSAKKKGGRKQQPGDVLRRFRYSYYCGLLKVETWHVCVDDANNNFRLVEYFDCPVSPWLAIYTVLPLLALIIRYCVRVYGCDVSFTFLVATALVSLHLVLHLTGVRVKQIA